MKTQNLKNGKYTEIRQDFDSINEFYNYINNAKIVNQYFQRESHLSSEKGSESFTGTYSYKDAESLLTGGWTVSSERITKKLKLTQGTTNTATKSKIQYSVVGGQASVPRYLQGIPTNMIDRKQVVIKNKIITLTKEISYSAFVSKEEMENEGVKALQVINALENGGYRVKLNVMWSVTSQNEQLTVRVCVKKPDERINISKIAFPIAHPSMLRRICFRYIERHQTAKADFTGGYGRPAEPHMDPQEYLIPKEMGSVEEYIQKIL